MKYLRYFLIFAFALHVFSTAVHAAPAFSGLREAMPGPGSAVLRWERAAGDDKRGSVTYRVYQRGPSGWNFASPLTEVKGNEWVILGLRPGVDHEFIVRARDASGEDANTASHTVRPANALPAEEWRAVWVARFHWTTGGNWPAIQRRLSEMFSTLAAANMNAVVFQVRGQGDTLYPSREEPWSTLLPADARNTDPVAFAISEAQRNGIEFHAWMNLSVIWQSGNKDLPADSAHPFFRMADARHPERRLGLIHDNSGNPRQWGSDSYVWLTHGNPDVNAYLRRQVMAFLAQYQVQGIHIDDRTGNPNGVSRDPVSLRRFQGRGNPARIADLGEWQRDQLTRFLSDLYVSIKAHNPRLLFSASPFGIADRRRISGYQNFSDGERFGVQPERWLSQGIIDVLMPQIYWDLPDPEPNYGTLVRDWKANNRSGRPIWPGSALGKYGDVQPLETMQERYVAMTRAHGLNGNIFYHFFAATPAQWRSFGAKVYPNKARVPVPRHMQPGQTGQVAGIITDAANRPVVDCWVAVSGRQYTYLSSADGFYGIPNLAPGEYTVTISPAQGQLHHQQVTVGADRTSRLDFRIPSN